MEKAFNYKDKKEVKLESYLGSEAILWIAFGLYFSFMAYVNCVFFFSFFLSFSFLVPVWPVSTVTGQSSFFSQFKFGKEPF